eukprot:CAMPEP_0172935238 /NCGR_PEP_ID=MMETSP1075-20121228/221416_1 /TAXON_ID=2916 /ORGANISM="Ceratium fusus, Strain PA161109" /LENGTH=102 /DNA_ID=CAMNT_0013796597 /DNA_START=1136 /DNA_END=1444 /DNA_ORIENTATION=+
MNFHHVFVHKAVTRKERWRGRLVRNMGPRGAVSGCLMAMTFHHIFGHKAVTWRERWWGRLVWNMAPRDAVSVHMRVVGIFTTHHLPCLSGDIFTGRRRRMPP